MHSRHDAGGVVSEGACSVLYVDKEWRKIVLLRERYITDCCFRNCRWRAQSDIAGRVRCFIICTFIFRNGSFYSKMTVNSYFLKYILKNTYVWNACGWFASLCSPEQWRNRLCVSQHSVHWLSFLSAAVFYLMKLIHIWTMLILPVK